MSVIPIFTAREVLRRLIRAGFKIINSKESHVKLYNPVTDRKTEVPMHPGDLGRKLTGKIIKQSGLTVIEFIRL